MNETSNPDVFFNIPEDRYTNTTLTFRNAKPTSDYIRILKVCVGEPKTLKEIYPGVSAPVADEVVALAKLGYLQKCTKPKYVYYTTWRDMQYQNFRKVWYYTTDKGRKLVEDVCFSTKLKKSPSNVEDMNAAKASEAAKNVSLDNDEIVQDVSWHKAFADAMSAFAKAMDAFSTAMGVYKTIA